MKSLALDVDLVTLAEVPLPELDTASPSKGEAVSAPLTPNATAAALVEPLKVIVIDIDPLKDRTAYHVSKCLLLEYGTLALRVQIKLGFEVILLTVWELLSTTDIYIKSFGLVVVKFIVIELPPPLFAEAEPSSPSGIRLKVAVIVPSPLIVAVVDADDGLAIVIDPVALQDENA
jgi:hypothetical protein